MPQLGKLQKREPWNKLLKTYNSQDPKIKTVWKKKATQILTWVLSLMGKDRGTLHRRSPTLMRSQSFRGTPRWVLSHRPTSSVMLPLLTSSQSCSWIVPACMLPMISSDTIIALHCPACRRRGHSAILLHSTNVTG